MIKKQLNKNICIFTYYFYPDLSAGSLRTKDFIDQLLKNCTKKNYKIVLITSIPNRLKKLNKNTYFFKSKNKNIRVIRLWVPFSNNSKIHETLSYFIYFFQAIPLAIFYRPKIIWATSAKSMTLFLALIVSKLTKAKLFLDVRDTFSDNYFYFYRWSLRKSLLLPLILFFEKESFRSARSINLISPGFQMAYQGLQENLKKKSYPITYFTNGISEKRLKEINNAKNKNYLTSKKIYKLVYVGNLGDGQDILSLIKDLKKETKIFKRFINSKIHFYIYGSGSQAKDISYEIKEGVNDNNQFNKFIFYKGFANRNTVPQIYFSADCLILHLGKSNSLNMVIPSKIFEYAATDKPIVYAAEGFTKNFISQINGSYSFEKSNGSSLLSAILLAKKEIKIDINKRKKFLSIYSSEKIYKDYSKHILS